MRLLLPVIVAVVVISGAAAAEETDTGSAALKYFQTGIELFNAQQYSEAATAFRKANELNPNWKLLFNIGQSEAASKRHGLALEAFEAYLSKGGDDIPEERMQTVEKEIERLRKIVGFIKVTAPPGSLITVDDVERGIAPLPGDLMVAASVRHRVRAGDLQEKTVIVAGGQTAVLTFEAPREAPVEADTPEPAAVPSEPVATPDAEDARPAAEERPSRLQIAGFATLGAGAAVLIGGVITGGLTLSANKEMETACPDGCYSKDYEKIDHRDNLALTTDVLIGVGSAAAVAGAVMVILAHRKKNADETVAFHPMISPVKSGLSVEWRF